MVKVDRKSLLISIDLFNKSKLPYSSNNFLLVAKVSRAEMRQRKNKYTAGQSTPQVNIDNLTNKNSTIHKKMLFKDAVSLLPHILFGILSH